VATSCKLMIPRPAPGMSEFVILRATLALTREGIGVIAGWLANEESAAFDGKEFDGV
jgi:hypothetical protein